MHCLHTHIHHNDSHNKVCYHHNYHKWAFHNTHHNNLLLVVVAHRNHRNHESMAHLPYLHSMKYNTLQLEPPSVVDTPVYEVAVLALVVAVVAVEVFLWASQVLLVVQAWALAAVEVFLWASQAPWAFQAPWASLALLVFWDF
jgi:hypothetical protein